MFFPINIVRSLNSHTIFIKVFQSLLLQQKWTELNVVKIFEEFRVRNKPRKEITLAKKNFNLFQYKPRCCSISTVRPWWSSGKTLAANAGGRGFESHRGHKNLFFTFYSIRVKREELCCKTTCNIILFKHVYS